MHEYQKIEEAVQWLQSKFTIKPQIGLVLGSGLGILGEAISDPIKIPFQEIPNFPVSTVKGHEGQVIVGHLEGKPILVMQGRVHFYEGYSMKQVVFPIRIMQLLGIKHLVITNASGGLHETHHPGDICLITDHINLMTDNPLHGQNDDRLGPRFPDLSQAYHPELLAVAQKSAAQLGISVKEGVYAGISGPNYETMAEIHYIRRIGADLVGMSTVPEVIAARHGGLNILGISCITDAPLNPAAQGVSHEEVVAVANEAAPKIANLIKAVLHQFPDELI